MTRLPQHEMDRRAAAIKEAWPRHPSLRSVARAVGLDKAFVHRQATAMNLPKKREAGFECKHPADRKR